MERIKYWPVRVALTLTSHVTEGGGGVLGVPGKQPYCVNHETAEEPSVSLR